jgi:hypothetical protein
MTKLEAVRDLLLPALRGYKAQAPEIDLEIKIEGDALLVIGRRLGHEHGFGFAITRKAIEDRTYIDQFRPCVEKVIECLRTAPPPQPNPAEQPQEQDHGAPQ